MAEDGFPVPKPRTQRPPSQTPGVATIDAKEIERAKKHKDLPNDVEHEGRHAQVERKRARAEDRVGPKFAGDLVGDDEFEEDAVGAAVHYSIKRKKKHKYTEDGMRIEPFSVREEQEDRIFDSTIVRDAKNDGSWDPWLVSVEDEMQKLDREKALKEQNSESESEGDDKGEDSGQEEDKDEAKEQVPEEIKFNLLEQICSILNSGESVRKALVRLRGNEKPKHVNFKKNVRKKVETQKAEEKKEEKAQEGNPELFQKLMELAERALEAGYLDVYTDPKEDVVFEAKQLQAIIARKNRPKE
eukprot:TRINITY_DN12205_c0_g1_i1.p1 TRINITY_DN12205_c0_g1~~TRINITY_DN12205_c0_g1_i1.p1  ORF type:complete len:300 (+),score=109.16 TRINITY_DN12205_c0_g1_i1:141-1040(+)